MFKELLDPPDHTPSLESFGAERFANRPHAVALMLAMGVVGGHKRRPRQSDVLGERVEVGRPVAELAEVATRNLTHWKPPTIAEGLAIAAAAGTDSRAVVAAVLAAYRLRPDDMARGRRDRLASDAKTVLAHDLTVRLGRGCSAAGRLMGVSHSTVISSARRLAYADASPRAVAC